MNTPLLNWNPLATLRDIEREAYKQALEHHSGNLTNAAEDLAVPRTTAYRRMSLLFTQEEIKVLRNPKKEWYE